MPADSLSRNAQKQIANLCRKITVSRSEDPEIQRELRGHIEDKMLAYMHSEIPVTEEDAFILVEKHFGDPAVIKEYFHGAYTDKSFLTTARRLTAALAAWAIATLLGAGLQWGAFIFPGIQSPYPQLVYISGVECFFVPWMMYRLLSSWAKPAASKEAWFQSLHILGIGAVTVLSILFYCGGYYSEKLITAHAAEAIFQGNRAYWFLAAYLIGSILAGMVWIGFCDTPPRTRRNLHTAAGAWALTMLITPAITVSTEHYSGILSISYSLLATVILACISLHLYRMIYWIRSFPKADTVQNH